MWHFINKNGYWEYRYPFISNSWKEKKSVKYVFWTRFSSHDLDCGALSSIAIFTTTSCHTKSYQLYSREIWKKTVSKSKSIKERKVTYVLMIPHYSLKYPWLYLVMLADMPYNYIFMADIFLYTPHRKQIICHIVSNKPLIYYRFQHW